MKFIKNVVIGVKFIDKDIFKDNSKSMYPRELSSYLGEKLSGVRKQIEISEIKYDGIFEEKDIFTVFIDAQYEYDDEKKIQKALESGVKGLFDIKLLYVNIVSVADAVRGLVGELLDLLKRELGNPKLYRKMDNGDFSGRPIEVYTSIPGYIRALKENGHISQKMFERLDCYYKELFGYLSSISTTELTSVQVDEGLKLIERSRELKKRILSGNLNI